jgi:hypothetical protein
MANWAEIPAEEIQILQQLAQEGGLSGVDPQIIAAIVQAESSGQGGSINSAGYGGFFGLGAGHNYPGGTSSSQLLNDPSMDSFSEQARIAASEFASLLQAAGGNPLTAEGYYQEGQGGYQPGTVTEGIGIMQQLGIGSSTTGYSPSTGTSNSVGTGPAATAQNYYDTSGTNIPVPPGIQDSAALKAYIQQYFGADAWMLNIPSVAGVLMTAVSQGRGNDTAYLQGLLQETGWYKTTSKAVQTFQQQSAQNPADYNFNVPGSVAAQTAADVANTAGQLGVTINTPTAQQLALQYLQYGWDANQLKAAVADTIYYTGQGGTAKTNAGSIISQLQSQAAQYYMNPNDPTLQSWAQNIAAGTQTIQQFDAYLKQNASLKWTGMSSQIQQGYTPEQITNSLRTTAAQTMEVDPTSIDFVNNPLYSKVLDYVPPKTATDRSAQEPPGTHRMMTQSEMEQYLRSTPQWSGTDNAKTAIGDLALTIGQTFGKVG